MLVTNPALARQGVQLKSQDVYPSLPEAARRPSTTTGIWHLLYDRDVKVTDVWFLRELSVDEYYRKVRVCILSSACGTRSRYIQTSALRGACTVLRPSQLCFCACHSAQCSHSAATANRTLPFSERAHLQFLVAQRHAQPQAIVGYVNSLKIDV